MKKRTRRCGPCIWALLFFICSALPATAQDDAGGTDGADGVDGERLANISILELSRLVSTRLDLTVVMSRRVRDDKIVNIFASGTIPDDELYELFLNALLMHDYVAVREGDMVSIVRRRKARSMPLPVVQ